MAAPARLDRLPRRPTAAGADELLAEAQDAMARIQAEQLRLAGILGRLAALVHHSGKDNLPNVLSTKEAAKRLGLPLSTFLDKLHSGQIRFVAQGRRYGIPRDAFLDYLAKLEGR